MKSGLIKIYVLFMILAMGTFTGHAQSTVSNKLLAIERSGYPEPVEDWYHGEVYNYPTETGIGSPFLNDQMMFLSDLEFNGRTYHNQQLFFDLLQHKLVRVVELQGGNVRYITLNPAAVSQFTYKDQKGKQLRFIGVDKVRSEQLGIPANYYEEIYSGKVQVLRHLEKSVRLSAGQYQFKTSASIWLIGDSGAKELTKKRDIFREYPEYKKQLKQVLGQLPRSYELLPAEELMNLVVTLESIETESE